MQKEGSLFEKEIMGLLLDKAIITETHCTWLSFSYQNFRSTGFSSMNYNFYDGLSGILFYLTNYYVEYKEIEIKILIDKVLRVCEELYYNLAIKKKFGFFDGIAGYYFILKYTEQKLGIVHNSTLISSLYNELLEHFFENPNDFDLISGSSGVIKTFSENNLLERELMEVCIKSLVSSAKDYNSSAIYWLPNNNDEPCGGLAHGVAGAAIGLFEAFQLTQNQEYLIMGMKALNFQELLFVKEYKNWKTRFSCEKEFPISWCYGSSGIGLAYLKAWELTKKDSYLEFLNIAIQNTINEINRFSNYSICHGVFGSINVLRYVTTKSHICKDQIKSLLHDFFLQQASDIFRYQNGERNNHFSPSYMLGITGIGQTMLSSKFKTYDPLCLSHF